MQEHRPRPWQPASLRRAAVQIIQGLYQYFTLLLLARARGCQRKPVATCYGVAAYLRKEAVCRHDNNGAIARVPSFVQYMFLYRAGMPCFRLACSA